MKQRNSMEINQASSRELEIEQVKRAIVKTGAEIRRLEDVLELMRQKQTRRQCEVVRQETLARCSNH